MNNFSILVIATVVSLTSSASARETVGNANAGRSSNVGSNLMSTDENFEKANNEILKSALKEDTSICDSFNQNVSKISRKDCQQNQKDISEYLSRLPKEKRAKLAQKAGQGLINWPPEDMHDIMCKQRPCPQICGSHCR